MATGGRQRLVAKLACLMTDAVPQVQYGHMATGGQGLYMTLDQGDRARALREISRIAMRYGWWSAVELALDEAKMPSLRHLETHQVVALSAHLRAMVDNAMTACDLTDDLPAG